MRRASASFRATGAPRYSKSTTKLGARARKVILQVRTGSLVGLKLCTALFAAFVLSVFYNSLVRKKTGREAVPALFDQLLELVATGLKYALYVLKIRNSDGYVLV